MTFLFTDIEGSTKRWEAYPEVMARALAAQEEILQGAIETHGGTVFKTVGDAFCAVFPEAANGARAALAAQRGLRDHAWADEIGALRVRMALHTGAAIERGADFFGPTLNRVARTLSAGHGGQVLVTEATCALLRGRLPDVELRDMGERRLKDLSRPEHVFQLVVDDLPSEFPPLKTLDARPNNLPVQSSPLVGRAAELALARRLLQRSDARLVTLTGPGGIGKTRLSLQLAADLIDDFDDGVYLVSLATIAERELVVSTIAQGLGLAETTTSPPVEQLKAHLRERNLLLVLDNFEQVVAAAPAVAELLAAAPRLRVLVTSRAALRLDGEHEVPVPPLALPPAGGRADVAALAENEAVHLFVERAQAVRPDFSLTEQNARAVAAVCLRLDGLPLALELAAARVRILTPSALLERLDSRLGLLTSGRRDVPARQQTLRDTIAWSHDLLGRAERAVFRRVAVFVGGFTLEAAEAVAGGDTGDSTMDEIEALVDKSLLRRVDDEQDGETRFRMLETIREFATEQLAESGEETAIRDAHGAFFAALVAEAEPHLTGPKQRTWVGRLDREHDNLRAALRWGLEAGDASAVLGTVAALWRFWMLRGHAAEGREWLDAALALPPSLALAAERARALVGAGVLAYNQQDHARAERSMAEGLEIWRVLGDAGGTGTALVGLGLVAHARGDYPTAQARYEESLPLLRAATDRRGVANTLNNLGRVAYALGDVARARALYEQALAAHRELGDVFTIANSLNNLGYVAHGLGDLAAARALLEEALTLRRSLGHPQGVANSLRNLGDVARDRGDLAEAHALYGESLLICREIGDQEGLAEIIEGLAALAAAEGDAELALRLGGAADALRESMRAPLSGQARTRLEAALARAHQALDPAAAAAIWEQGRSLSADEALAARNMAGVTG